MLQAGRDCHRRGPMHPEHEWWAWALALPKQFVPSGYRSTLAYVWRRWLAFRLNRTCPGCGKEARRPRPTRGRAARGALRARRGVLSSAVCSPARPWLQRAAWLVIGCITQ